MCLRLVFVEVSRTRSLDGCCRGHAEGHDRCAQNLSPDIPRLHPQTLSISGCPKVEVQMGKGWKAVPGTKVGASISGVPIAAAVTRHPPDRWAAVAKEAAAAAEATGRPRRHCRKLVLQDAPASICARCMAPAI